MKKRSIFKTRKFYIVLSVFLVIGLFAFLISDYLTPREELTYTAETGYYETEQNPIKDIVDPEGEEYFSISNFYTYTGS